VLGGCDSMQVGAFDEVVRPPDDFSLRIARNTQLVLQRECGLNRVIDPPGGSWFVETVTAELAGHAWTLFQDVEKLGGMAARAQRGLSPEAVAATAAERIKSANRRRIHRGREPIREFEGTAARSPAVNNRLFHKRRVQQVTSHRTSFNDGENEIVMEKLSKVFEFKGAELFEACVAAVAAGGTLGEITRALRINDRPATPVTPVCLTRASVAFERLRAAADVFTAANQERPRCSSATRFAPRYKARSEFPAAFSVAAATT